MNELVTFVTRYSLFLYSSLEERLLYCYFASLIATVGYDIPRIPLSGTSTAERTP